MSRWSILHYLRQAGIIALAFIPFLMSIPRPVSALTDCQKLKQDSNVRYFNCDETKFIKTCSAGSANLSGSDNNEKIWNFFISQGFQPFQAAGIMGNMQAEASFEPRLVEFGWPNSRGETSVQGEPSSLDDNVPPNAGPNGEPGYGLIQWTSPGRKQGLRDLVAKNNVMGSDLGTQLQYIMQELQGPYKSAAYDPLMATSDVDSATNVILENYERPHDMESQRSVRQYFAREILNTFGSSGGTTTSPPGSSTCAGGGNGSGQVVAGYSLPVDRHWYDEHPDWFSLKHQDYPAVDIPVPEGTNVYSATAGTILSAPVGGDCGDGVIVKRDDDGTEFKYCHGMDGGSVPSAKNGDKVVAGQLIMHSDNTGSSSGPHLHFEIVAGGLNRCPGPLLDGIAKGSPPDVESLATSGCVE